ncbi:hypothetical protein X797_011671 [Metarhizium robertsii]|uniref:Uncharacterized protein n=1 Tax=Metarhizium robertsii TaxID=568076 RepID=A0A0A1UMH1_9HYPO|nr:hypothetical protein X797_011671 [Metarhizium robertsii]
MSVMICTKYQCGREMLHHAMVLGQPAAQYITVVADYASSYSSIASVPSLGPNSAKFGDNSSNEIAPSATNLWRIVCPSSTQNLPLGPLKHDSHMLKQVSVDPQSSEHTQQSGDGA